MNRMYWTVMEAVELLNQVYLVDLGGRGLMAPAPITLEALARALDARPEVLEQVWNAGEEESEVQTNSVTTVDHVWNA